MIVEFVEPTCAPTADPAPRAEMRAARAAFTAACGQPDPAAFRRLSGSARITGVGFFDVLHGQTGVAPNGIELHPVLHFEPASCTKR
jgi:hypothetical protein